MKLIKNESELICWNWYWVEDYRHPLFCDRDSRDGILLGNVKAKTFFTKDSNRITGPIEMPNWDELEVVKDED